MFREQLVWKNFYIPNLESIGHADNVFIDYFVGKDHNDKHIFAQMIHLLLGNKRAFFLHYLPKPSKCVCGRVLDECLLYAN